MDIVYLLKDTSKNEELVYSLRSLVNLPHDKVYLVGGCPLEINKERVTHIPTRQTNDKYKNTTTSIEVAARDPRISEDFILMNDDFFILQPIKDPEKELNLCRGPINEVLAEYTKRYGPDANSYLIGMRQTNIYLQDLGVKEPLSYELHIPITMAKTNVLRLFQLPYLHSLQVIHKRTIYGNLFKNNSQQVEDVKVRRKTYWPIYNQKFLSTEDDSWQYVKPYIHSLFPGKGPYEI